MPRVSKSHSDRIGSNEALDFFVEIMWSGQVYVSWRIL